MLGILNKKISIEVGIIVILLVATFAGWLIIRQYKEIIELRFENIEMKAFGDIKK